MIFIKTSFCQILFVYLSKGVDITNLKEFMDKNFDMNKNIAIMGDFNQDGNDENCRLIEFMKQTGFTQLIQDPTHEEGGLLDHIYVNQLLYEENVVVRTDPVYYSDHDIVTLLIPKK